MVVEDILDLDLVYLTGNDEWDRQFRQSGVAKRGQHDEEREAARIGEQLDRWREMLPVHLTPNDSLSPLPHVFIGLAVRCAALNPHASNADRLSGTLQQQSFFTLVLWFGSRPTCRYRP